MKYIYFIIAQIIFFVRLAATRHLTPAAVKLKWKIKRLLMETKNTKRTKIRTRLYYFIYSSVICEAVYAPAPSTTLLLPLALT